jgi:hypothetical protein
MLESQATEDAVEELRRLHPDIAIIELASRCFSRAKPGGFLRGFGPRSKTV